MTPEEFARQVGRALWAAEVRVLWYVVDIVGVVVVALAVWYLASQRE